MQLNNIKKNLTEVGVLIFVFRDIYQEIYVRN